MIRDARNVVQEGLFVRIDFRLVNLVSPNIVSEMTDKDLIFKTIDTVKMESEQHDNARRAKNYFQFVTLCFVGSVFFWLCGEAYRTGAFKAWFNWLF
jgi:hypothetical protein